MYFDCEVVDKPVAVTLWTVPPNNNCTKLDISTPTYYMTEDLLHADEQAE